MAIDAELDRLKAAKDLAFQCKQDAYKVQEQARERRTSAHHVLNIAYDAKQHAYAKQQASWEEFQRVRSKYGPRHESLIIQQEPESGDYKSKQRRLIQKNRSTRAKHEATRLIFQRAKQDFNAAKRIFDAAKAEHIVTQLDFTRAKEDFEAASQAFLSRLDYVNPRRQKRR